MPKQPAETLPAADVRLVPIPQLHQAPWNPRVADDERMLNLKATIEADPNFMWLRPVLADAQGEIYAGNHRHKAVELLDQDGRWPWPGKIPAVVQDVDDTTKRERAIRDNNNWASWEKAGLEETLRGLADAGAAVDLLGFDASTLTRILDGADKQKLAQQQDGDGREAGEAPKRVRAGDVWQLGPHRLICGDSTDAAVLARLMGDEIATMVWTDPPYGVAYIGKTKDALTIENDNLSPDATRALVRDALTVAKQYMSPGCSWYVCSPAGDLELQFRLALIDAGLQLRQAIVWVKDQFVLGRQDYHWRHESILLASDADIDPADVFVAKLHRTLLYGWNAGDAHHFVRDRTLDTVWEFDRPRASEQHPTMKPVELVANAIANSSVRDTIVLDSFAGSGSTLMACHELGRQARLVELSPTYCDRILTRYEDATGEEALKVA